MLTASTAGDSFVGTALNDLFTSAAGTLQNADTILDSSTTDADILNAEVTLATAAPRIQNIETINVDGKYTTTGISLLSVSGTTDLNLNTGITGGTATVINAASINAKNITSGSNVTTLNVTATASGTRDTVNVDAGSATLKLGGGAALDTFNGTTTGNVVLGAVDAGTAAFTAIDSVTLNLSDAATTITGDGALGALTINQTGVAGTITVAGAELTADIGTTATAMTTITGDQDVTLSIDTLSFITDTALTNSGTGNVTVKLKVNATAADLSDVLANTVEFNTATTASTVIVNTDTAVKLTEDMNSAMVFDQAAATAALDTALAAGAGTLLLEVAHNQGASTTTGAAVGTLLLSAGVDSTVTDGSDITIADLGLHANTNTVVISGAEDLKLTALSNNGDEVISASSMTGNLTIVTVDASSTMVLGAGNDVIGTVGGNTVTGAHTIHAGAGNDTITFGAAATAGTINGEAGDDTIDVTGAAAQTINGGTGNDTITGSANIDTIDGGAGDDVINGAAGNDKITLGAGNDTVIIAASEGTDVISDFVLGTDKLVLRGTGASATVNVTNITPATNTYTIDTNFVTTLTGITATDISNSVQFGDSKTAYTTAATANVTTGALNDYITTGATAVTVVAGAGDDTINASATNSTLTGGTGSDTFNVTAGTAAIQDLGTGDILKTAAGATDTTAKVTSDFTATAASTTGEAAANVVLTLNDGINVDLSLVTLAAASNGYTVNTFASATVGSTIVGSKGADILNGSAFVDTITGGEGADTIVAGKGADIIDLTEQVTASDLINYTAFDQFGDVITGFASGSDKIQISTALMTSAGTEADALASITSTGTIGVNDLYVEITTATAAGKADTAAEIVTHLSGLTMTNVAAGEEFLLAVNDGTDTYLWLYAEDDGSTMEAAELTLAAKLVGVTDVANGDFVSL